MSVYKSIPATFVVGQTETEIISLNEGSLSGIVISGSNITGSLVSFLVSSDGTNFFPLFNESNTEVTLVVSSTPKAYALATQNFIGWLYIKARLGTSGSAKAQSGSSQPIILLAK